MCSLVQCSNRYATSDLQHVTRVCFMNGGQVTVAPARRADLL